MCESATETGNLANNVANQSFFSDLNSFSGGAVPGGGYGPGGASGFTGGGNGFEQALSRAEDIVKQTTGLGIDLDGNGFVGSGSGPTSLFTNPGSGYGPQGFGAPVVSGYGNTPYGNTSNFTPFAQPQFTGASSGLNSMPGYTMPGMTMPDMGMGGTPMPGMNMSGGTMPGMTMGNMPGMVMGMGGTPEAGHPYTHHMMMRDNPNNPIMLAGEALDTPTFDGQNVYFETGITGNYITLAAARQDALEENPDLQGRALENKMAQILTGYNAPDDLPEGAQRELDSYLTRNPQYGAPYDDLSDDQQREVRHLFLHSMVGNNPVSIQGMDLRATGEGFLQTRNGTAHTIPDPGNFEEAEEHILITRNPDGTADINITSQNGINNGHDGHSMLNVQDVGVAGMSDNQIKRYVYENWIEPVPDNNDDYPLSRAALGNGRAMGYPL
jgi:hypothetical protein